MVKPLFYPPCKGITPSPPIGRCIYCDSMEPPLTKEHVIPESLGGNLTLRKASCETHREITRRNEQIIARELFQDVCAELGLKVKEPPSHVILRNGFEPNAAILGTVRVEDYPRFLSLIIPEPPGIMSGRVRDAPVPFQLFAHTLGDDGPRKERRDKLGLPSLMCRSFDPRVLGLFLAKVGLGTAVQFYGLDSFDSGNIRKIIDGDNDPFYLVGGTTEEMIDLAPAYARISHRGTTYRHDLNGVPHVVVQVQLFAQLGLPVFTIVIGQLSPTGLQKSNMETEFRYT